ncbi:MAG: hypothetical protein WC455_14525 [Dehalococcoidia bacterium]
MGIDINSKGYRPGKMIGMSQLTKNVKHLIESIDDGDLENALLRDAVVLRDQIIARAPKGPPKPKGINPSKILKRAIVAKKFREKLPGKPAAFVAINYGIAPHAHLVEFGHEASGWYKNKGGGKVPAHPFFRNTARGFKKGYNLEAELKRKFSKDLPV